jgi:hypothetical protein
MGRTVRKWLGRFDAEGVAGLGVAADEITNNLNT